MNVKPKPVLIVAILFKSRGAIGGMAQRFCLIGNECIARGYNVEMMTTRSLLDALELKRQKHIFILEDDKGRVSVKSLLRVLIVMVKIGFSRYSQVHIAGAGRLLPFIVWLSKLSKTRLSCTFASRTLEMASYGRAEDEAKWISLLNSVDIIDVLNPSHNLYRWQKKIRVSPCSFPSKRDFIVESFSHERAPVAIFCGSLERNKNPILAMEIVEQYVKKTDSQLELFIFGRGSLFAEVEEKMVAINNCLGRPVIKFGEYSDLMRCLSRANIFFSLQEIDNYPSQSMMEAMLLGCKIIATDEGDTRAMLPPHGRDNATVNSRSPSSYLNAVDAALANPRASYDNAEYVKSNHSIDNFLDYFCDLANIKR
ncbi:glycosyltransferase [Porticoccus hydrocarbonoclasticus]|jgi:glycosyltransferase involved in cell wall biosynthesis|uniref:glycosyltransferase n=1 Tax=Porticoccus hydrocarbonoclasticus TaxID=1073414 RepID=UPI0030EDFD8B|tara:strand:+ start:559 stop:1662 length:1104 start_codon:yes stop_codon:yes gene_type:complete